MKKIILAKEVEIDGNLLPINSRPDLGSGCFLQILKAINDQLGRMLSLHSKVYIVRFDLHCSGYSANNTIISEFMSKFIRALKKCHRPVKKVGFIWAREKGIDSPSQHYHLALILDGHVFQTPVFIKQIAESIWLESFNQMQVQHQWGGARMLGRNDEE